MTMTMTGRQMPVRTAEVDLGGNYAGFTVTVRTNPPYRVFKAFDAALGNFEAILDVLLDHLILDWNLVDEQGEPLPRTRDALIDRFPYDALEVLATKVNDTFSGAKAGKDAGDSSAAS